MFMRTRLSDVSNSFVMSLISGSKNRSLPVSICLGIMLASKAQLTATDQDSSGTFFIQQVKPGIDSAIGKINEIVPIDIEAVSSYARKFYQFRQEQINGMGLPISGFNETSGLVDFFGITKFFSAEDIAVINKETPLLTNYWVRFQNILKELG